MTCTTAWSWMLVRAPTRMELTSPRTTAPNQTEEPAPSSTSPTTTLPAARNTDGSMRGLTPPKALICAIQRRMLARALPRRKTSHASSAPTAAPMVSASQSATSAERCGTKRWWSSSLSP